MAVVLTSTSVEHYQQTTDQGEQSQNAKDNGFACALKPASTVPSAKLLHLGTRALPCPALPLQVCIKASS
jgi:hypothetical protein